MSAAKKYRIADAERQKRYDEFVSQLSPSDLRAELAACRLTLEGLLSAPNPSAGMIGNLLTVAGKLAAAHQLIQERAGETVGREELAHYTRGIIEAVADSLIDLPDYHERMDRIITAISNIRQPEPTPKLLEIEQ